MQKKTFLIISMATYGKGLSGGDRIWIEFVKQIRNNHQVFIYLWEEGITIAKRENLKDSSFILWSAKSWAKFGFLINYFARIFIAIFKTISLKIKDPSNTIVFSASEFWQDSLPAFILKTRYPKIKWVAAWYQTAPSPLRGYNEINDNIRFPLKAFLYYLVQFPIKPLINKNADLILVNNEIERKKFGQLNKKEKLFVMLGGVDIGKIQSYKKNFRNLKKEYEGVFQGRFHPQKGVEELIDIWKLVTSQKYDAKLAMIGDGPLMAKVVNKIKENNLEKNIKLFGYLFDGKEKYKIFSQSKVVLHPAFFDSGGMAAAEAMAFGLPAVGFDLAAYQSYYPKGMVKVKKGDLQEFANQVVKLIIDRKYYERITIDGIKMLDSEWSWKKRMDSLLKAIYVI